MEKTVTIGEKTYQMRASALIPRLYRAKFGRDIVTDMRRLQKKYLEIARLQAEADEETRANAQLSMLDLTIFEDVAWLMMKHAGEDVGDTPEEWLDSMDGIFSVYQILPSILALWNNNQKTTSIAKKKQERRFESRQARNSCCAVPN